MPTPEHEDRRPDAPEPAPRTPPPSTRRSEKYPYLHPEPLHSEHLAVTAADILAFLDHYGDEGPDLKSSSQAP